MRRFRFVGDPKDYETNEPPFFVNQIYQGDFIGEGCMSTVEEYANRPWSSNAWQEVFDEPKPLHKDTDLGYYTLELLKIRMNSRQDPFSNFYDDVNDFIQKAKELIKQLDNETN